MTAPPMTAEEALVFAFDWPDIRFLLPCCCTCRAFVRRARLIEHMDTRHPGWLERWNAMIGQEAK